MELAIAAIVFFILDYVSGKLVVTLARLSRKGDVENARFIIRIVLLTIVISTLAYVNGQYVATTAFLIIMAMILIVGTRPVLEEYFTGKVARLISEHRFDIGDHVEINGNRGYVVKQTPLGLIVRSPRNELVYIPYTLMMKELVKKVSPQEGFEIRVPFKVPRDSRINMIREKLREYMAREGISDPSVEVMALDRDYVELVARGTYRDLRTLDEVRYRVLDMALKLLSEE